MNSPLLLCSNSPRRREILQNLGFEIRVLGSQADETRLAGEGVKAYLHRVCRLKMQSALKNDGQTSPGHNWHALSADTVVFRQSNRLLGKPGNIDEARQMLSELSGCVHYVASGVVYSRQYGQKYRQTFTSAVSRVWFNRLNASQIDEYIERFSPFDKAGSYGIQDNYGLVSKFSGSLSNVIGLPVREILPILYRQG